MELAATKVKKNKKQKVVYQCGAVKVKYKIKNKVYDLWLVVTKRKNGGYCWLLTRSPKEGIIDIIKEAFTAYGFRWKIEEYHRHIKSCYNLEDIQIKTFEGLQSMLAILTIAMSVIYSSLSSLHIKLLLQPCVKKVKRKQSSKLRNYLPQRLMPMIAPLPAHVTPCRLLPLPRRTQEDGQL